LIYDLIIVTQSTRDLIQMTQNCIDSARIDDADLNIIIIETGSLWDYKGVNEIIRYNGEFNYNRALNMGLQRVKGEVYILANNDLIFHEGWSQIGELMLANGYHSASVLSQSVNGFQRGNFIYEGYEVGKHITGWCIFMDRYCRETIGQLDETCSFWYSDDLYACQLKAVGITHGMFCNLQVDHITSRTLVKQNAQLQRKYQIGEMFKFKQRKKYYLCLERKK